MSLDPNAFPGCLLELRQRRHQLAELLLKNAQQVECSGTPPTASLVDELLQFRHRYQSLIANWNQSHPTTPLSAASSLDDLDVELTRYEQSQHACLLARDILSISTRDGVAHPELEAVQAAACSVLASHGMELSSDQVEALRVGRHPWCDLLRMIQERDSLSDAEWSSLTRSIDAYLGSGLAVAATRGRLFFERPEAEVETAEVPSSNQEVTSSADLPVTDDAEPVTLPFRGNTDNVIEPVVATVPMDNGEIERIGADVASLLAELPDDSGSEVAQVPVEEIAGESAPIATQSVFDDIAPVSLQDLIRLEAQAPAKDTAPAINVWRSTSIAPVDRGSIFDDDSDQDDDLIRRKTTTPRNTLVPALPIVTDEAIPALAEKLLRDAEFVDPTGASASLATRIFNGPEAERLTLLPDLILHLIHEGRPGLAYHLARSLEARTPSETRFVPSWLIRTWTFGHALTFPKGQLAGLIQEDIQNSKRNDLTADRDWSLALSLLVRAATLRPAVIAPSSRAAAVLRDFDLQENCVQLYNYCSRIGTYGERIQGVFPGLFKQTRESVPYADQLSSLHADIARWSGDDVVPMRYEMASPLFQKTHWSLRAATSQRSVETVREWMSWQVALRLGESMIQPVLGDRRTELSRVRSEVEEVSTRLAASEDGMSQFSHSGVRAYLRQVTTFAQRWISLHSGASASESQVYLPQAAVELRSEVEKRHEAVLQELKTLSENSSSFEVRMAVSCLMLSVQEIRDLVDPLTPTETREPDPRHLLHSELLKIPELRLTTNWEPELDPHTIEDEILKYLSQPQPDWIAAFKMQLAQGNDAAAERILSLTLWTSEERDALESVLRQHRSRQKSEFAQQLAAVRHLVADSVHLDILPETERVGIETRLARLQLSINSDSGASSGILELERVRDSLMKRREREAERIRSRLRKLHGSPAGEGESPPPPPASPKGWVMDFES